MFATTVFDSNGTRYNLTVDALPNLGKWEWLVWRAIDSDRAPGHGVAQTADSAMSAAESLVADMIEGESPSAEESCQQRTTSAFRS
jgi:hypothetical protein